LRDCSSTGGRLRCAISAGVLPTHEAEWLESLGARLAVPIGGGDERLVGLLLVGEKTDEPYPAKTGGCSKPWPGEIAIVYENASLKRAAIEDGRVKQEVLARVDASGLNLLKSARRRLL
jgi:hypothetical protein